MSAPFNEFGPFAVGEVCRIVHSDDCPYLIGTEVKITSLPEWRSNGSRVWIGYGTDLVIEGGFHFDPPEEYLRRRKPPATDSHERTFMADIRKLADKAPQRVKESV